MGLLIITGFCICVYFAFRLAFKDLNYWSDRNVKGPKPFPLIGTFPKLILRKETLGRAVTKIYDKFPKEKLVGVYVLNNPTLVIRDPNLIKHVMIKDFDYFMNRGISIMNNTFHENLILAENERWRLLRQKLTPAFTSGKLKKMFYLIMKCAHQLDNYMQHLVGGKMELEVRALTETYTLEAIGNCAFGIEINGFYDEDNIYFKMGNRLLENNLKDALIIMLSGFFPGLVKMLKLDTEKTDAVTFFLDLVGKLLKEREGKEKVRHDFVDILIEMKEQGSIKGNMKHGEIEIEMTHVLITSQVAIFCAAGFETSSATMAFAIHELALNPDIQKKARNEIDSIFQKYGEITYESLREMEYLEMILSETLRKYPVAEALPRKCIKKYTFPDSGITIDENVKVLIPVKGLHHDPEYYPEPEKFIPERFTSTEKQKRHPCVYMPFGEGPRICIAMRFAKVISLVALATVLRKFHIKPSKRMSNPMKLSPVDNVAKVIGGVWVDFESRQNLSESQD